MLRGVGRRRSGCGGRRATTRAGPSGVHAAAVFTSSTGPERTRTPRRGAAQDVREQLEGHPDRRRSGTGPRSTGPQRCPSGYTESARPARRRHRRAAPASAPEGVPATVQPMRPSVRSGTADVATMEADLNGRAFGPARSHEPESPCALRRHRRGERRRQQQQGPEAAREAMVRRRLRAGLRAPAPAP
jgi:hypothetical protein